MKARTFAIVAGLSLMMAGIAVAQTRDENAQRCAGGSPDVIIAACTAVIQSGQESSKDQAIAFSNRGSAYSNKGEADRAIRDFDEAIKLDPNYAAAYYNRGSAYDDLGRYDRAIEDYSKAIQLDPGFDRAFNNRGIAYQNLHHYERAIADYDEAIRLDRSKAIRWNNRCWAKLLLGRLEQAAPDCSEGLRLSPGDGASLVGLGVIHLRQKKPADALRNCTAAAQSVRNAYTLYCRGLAKRLTGDRVGGDADLAAAKQLDAGIAATFEKDFHLKG